ncbi:MAG TPA: chemotaxis protein CheW [Anaeromyxobacter sp.]|nr:chemotaxis protein CheW [Anaeromyxobacter sp.]
MDFLDIRRKAKERAATREAEGEAARSEAPKAGAGVPPPSPQAPVLTEADVVEGKLAARLQGLPEPGPAAAPEQGPAGSDASAPAPDDPRFTTWRPGSGERPRVAPPDPAPEPTPRPSDFAVYAPPSGPGRAPSASPAVLHPLAAPPGFEARPAQAETAELVPPSSRDLLAEFFYREDEEVPALAVLPAEAGPVEDAASDRAEMEEFLTFRLGAEEYAVAIERVREVLKAQPVTEVPRAPSGILGVVTVRGEVVAVFDPRRRLGLPGPPPPEGTGRVVIVDDGGGPCGLLVDAVASVVRLPRGTIEPCPQGIGGASADCLAGIGRERNRLFTVLDLAALLRRGAPGRGARGTHAGA